MAMSNDDIKRIADEAFAEALAEANRKLDSRETKLPVIEADHLAPTFAGPRMPLQLEKRITEMRIDHPLALHQDPPKPNYDWLSDDGGGGGSGENHPWKVYSTPPPEGASPSDTYVYVVGGTIYTQGCFSDGYVLADNEAEKVTATGKIILRMTRDAATRELVSADTYFISATADPPVPDNVTQYLVLATVTLKDKVLTILQQRFDDVQIYEALAVSNGEFELVPLEMLGSTPYAPPVP